MSTMLKGLWDSVHQALLPASSFMADTLSIPNFVPHGPLFFVSLACFTCSQGLAPMLAKRVVPDIYAKLSRNNRYAWTVHSVSMLHSTLVAPWALYLTIQSSPAVNDNRVFGWDPRVGTLVSVSAAYFVWDTIESILSGADTAFAIHGAACSFIYISGYRPFSVYFGPRALIWELSTPFLNMHWFFDKAGMTGSMWQLVNGILLLAIFFGVRLVYGMVVTVQFFQAMYDYRHEAPLSLVAFYIIANLILYGLSWFWFGKMIAALRKRFPDESKTTPSSPPIITLEKEAGFTSDSNETIDLIFDCETLKVPNGDEIKLALRTNGQHLAKRNPKAPSLF
ncbi:hypothetical protein FRB95_011582 [Tulasnella sp. JGI-2019a]|nr:hypothetical protein FRB93_004807 [Tulasnella sp. JGI-2019a]KAG9035287.1 hypothetical protein FRB95_011582 [Tulasnella sp. JGI-2019a]